MKDLEKVARNGYEPLVRINENDSVFHVGSGSRDLTVDFEALFKNLPATIIDKQTLSLIQLRDLHEAVDHTTSKVGSATLFRSLMQPPTSLGLILAKQNSVRELESDDKLRNAVVDYLGEFQIGEMALFKFLNGQIHEKRPYGDFRKAMNGGSSIARAAKSIPLPYTGYLKFLLSEIDNFEQSAGYKLMRGPIYRTFGGLKSKEDISFFTPCWRFKPANFTLENLIGILTVGGLMGSAVWLKEGGDFFLASLLGGKVSMLAAVFHGLGIKPPADYTKVIKPLRKKIIRDEQFICSVESIGKLDELMSFIAYRKSMPHPTTLPEVTDAGIHYFIADNLRNPIEAKENKNYVPNSVNLNGARLTFITGPNSGGKTTYCKSILQNQLLGQIGGYVVASEAKMNLTDRMAYQAPQFDALQEEEGRFGTELKRTRDIFYSTTPRSLIVLDELAEGTTVEEKMQLSRVVLDGFHTIGSNTILVTHNHALVDYFKEDGKGQYLQVEFSDEKPTHRLIDGISKESHADRVAERIGFSGEAINRHLKEQGYLRKRQSYEESH